MLLKENQKLAQVLVEIGFLCSLYIDSVSLHYYRIIHYFILYTFKLQNIINCYKTDNVFVHQINCEGITK